MKRLIVTADDFGAAPEVNEAVERAHREGILTAASLMVGGAAAGDAVARARRLPGLRIGLHLTLLEGTPVLPRKKVADLLNSQGAFRTDMGRFGFEIFTRASVRRQVEAEIEAQFVAFKATGLPLDHVNAHKHFHLHPTLANIILNIGARYGLQSVRVPYEPREPLLAVEPSASVDHALDTVVWAKLLRVCAHSKGIGAADSVFGLRWSGAMSRKRLAGVIANLPEGLSEIYLHPATGAYAGSAPGYHYREELDALCDADVAGEIRRAGICTGGYSDFEKEPMRISARIQRLEVAP